MEQRGTLEPHDTAALIERAVDAARSARDSGDPDDPEIWDPIWSLVYQAAADGPESLRVGGAMLGSPDPHVRAFGCDLLGAAADIHESCRADAASALLDLAPNQADETDETDEAGDDVQWSIARALGKTWDQRARPALLALAGHQDPDVRVEVALALAGIVGEDWAGPDVDALIRLTRDPAPEVRNWATFGLGFLIEVDTPAVRAALWDRTGDEHPEAREEGIRGLARRRDQRAITLIAELLDHEDGAHVHTFMAAAILGTPELLPHLEEYETGIYLAEALAACDPEARVRLEQFAAALLDGLGERLSDDPHVDVALYGSRFEAGFTLDVTAGTDCADCAVSAAAASAWDVQALLDRSGGDPALAVGLVLGDRVSSQAG